MPNIITSKDGGNGNNITTGSKYQKFDYLIAAETGIFNYNKNVKGEVPIKEGQNINSATINDLDPTLVKATIMQESTMGTAKIRGLNNPETDIMQSNVCYDPSKPNDPDVSDWNPGKLDFGLTLGGGANPQKSIHAGIGIMFRKGTVTDDGKTMNFTSWENASKKYNGGGAANYENVLKMRDAAIPPTPANYSER